MDGGLAGGLGGEGRFVAPVDEDDLVDAGTRQLVGPEVDPSAVRALPKSEAAIGDGTGIGVLPGLVAAPFGGEAETLKVGERGPADVAEPRRVDGWAVALEGARLLDVGDSGVGELGHRYAPPADSTAS